jgi:hypothetical protein
MAAPASNRARGFWVRHYQVLAPVIAIAASAVALGPESWMEYLMAGVTVISHPTLRVLLLVLAVLLAVGLAWPFIRPTHHEEP